jgi:nitrogen PTS system EIIA component
VNTPKGFSSAVNGDSIILDLHVASKDALMVALAGNAARATGIAGSTGFGQGAAIPHARIAGLADVTAVVARLAIGVDYGALDGEPVDIAVLLLSPEGAGADHLKALARVSRALRDPASLARLRDAVDTAEMRAAIRGEPAPRSGQRAA